jgi:hypothetical protein
VVLCAEPAQVDAVVVNTLFAEWMCRWQDIEFSWSRDDRRRGMYRMAVLNSGTGRSAEIVCRVYCMGGSPGACGATQCIVELQKREGDGQLCHMLFKHMRVTFAGYGWCPHGTAALQCTAQLPSNAAGAGHLIPQLVQLCTMATSYLDDCAIEAGCALLALVSGPSGVEWLTASRSDNTCQALPALCTACEELIRERVAPLEARRQAVGVLLARRLEAFGVRAEPGTCAAQHSTA